MSISLDFNAAVLRPHSLPHTTAGSLVYALYSFTNHSQACWNQTGFCCDWSILSLVYLIWWMSATAPKTFWDHFSTKPCNRTQMWQSRPGFYLTDNGGRFDSEQSKLHKKQMWRLRQALQSSDPAVVGRRIHNWTPKMAGNRAYMSICIFLKNLFSFLCTSLYLQHFFHIACN